MSTMSDEKAKRDFVCQECGAILPSEDTPHNIVDCLERLTARVVVLESEKAELQKRLTKAGRRAAEELA